MAALRSRIEVRGVPAIAAAVLFLAASPAGAATITVNGTSDAAANDGVCTLREAIIAANTNTASGGAAGECAAGAAGLDTIAFNIPGAGVKTITPASPLPPITEAVFINGYTQGVSSPNTNAFNAGINAVILIELNGDAAGGLTVNAAGSVIRGLNIHGLLGDQITINAGSVTIAGNFLGTNPAGTVATGGSGVGIRLSSGDNCVFGGPAAADRNLVSGDTTGPVSIFLTSGNGTLIQGNYIGTDVTGTLALNVSAFNSPGGINIHSPASNTTILGNLISGNSGGGADLLGGGTVQGNLVGTQRDGVGALGNSNFGGINFNGTGFLIGGTSLGQSNTIAFNAGVGVRVQNNAFGHTILGNSIFSNTLLGISLSSGAPLANDACDVDTLPGNLGQNYPVLTSASIAAGNVTISGTLNSAASTTYRVEFFSNITCHASGNGEGRTFLGFATVTTDGTCNASFGPLVFAISGGQTIITATATDPANNTSEFSVCLNAAGAPPTPTPTTTPTTIATATPTTTPTVTPTPTTGPPGAASNIPTLSDGMLALLGLALVAAALTLLKRGV